MGHGGKWIRAIVNSIASGWEGTVPQAVADLGSATNGGFDYSCP